MIIFCKKLILIFILFQKSAQQIFTTQNHEPCDQLSRSKGRFIRFAVVKHPPFYTINIFFFNQMSLKLFVVSRQNKIKDAKEIAYLSLYTKPKSRIESFLVAVSHTYLVSGLL